MSATTTARRGAPKLAPVKLSRDDFKFLFRTTDTALASTLIDECFTAGVVTVCNFVDRWGIAPGATGMHESFGLLVGVKMRCTPATGATLVQNTIRRRFEAHMAKKRGRYEHLNHKDPETARAWAKFLRKRPDLAQWFGPAAPTDSAGGAP